MTSDIYDIITHGVIVGRNLGDYNGEFEDRCNALCDKSKEHANRLKELPFGSLTTREARVIDLIRRVEKLENRGRRFLILDDALLAYVESEDLTISLCGSQKTVILNASDFEGGTCRQRLYPFDEIRITKNVADYHDWSVIVEQAFGTTQTKITNTVSCVITIEDGMSDDCISLSVSVRERTYKHCNLCGEDHLVYVDTDVCPVCGLTFGQNPYVCTQCGEKFTNADSLNYHEENGCHVEGDGGDGGDDGGEETRSWCSVPGCGKTFSTEEEKDYHEKYVHGLIGDDSDEQRFLCDRCSEYVYGYTTESEFKESHVKYCTGSTKVELLCRVCQVYHRVDPGVIHCHVCGTEYGTYPQYCEKCGKTIGGYVTYSEFVVGHQLDCEG